MHFNKYFIHTEKSPTQGNQDLEWPFNHNNKTGPRLVAFKNTPKRMFSLYEASFSYSHQFYLHF